MNANQPRQIQLHRMLAVIMATVLVLGGFPLQMLAQDAQSAMNELQKPKAPEDAVDGIGPLERAAQARLITRPLNLPDSPEDLALQTARIFEEPLVPGSAPPADGENKALTKAVLAFRAKGTKEDVTSLTAFINAFPNSRWRASLELNLGLLAIETGYISRALTHLRAAWDKSKNEPGHKQDLLAQRAVSELLILQARLGMKDELEQGLAELGERPMVGSSAERIDAARQGLRGMKLASKLSFRCGPHALNTILYIDRSAKAIDPRVEGFLSTAQGTNLAQLHDWANELGLDLQMARRSKGAVLPLPALMHWKTAHFAAVTAQSQGKFRVQDPTFERHANLWMSAQAIDAETDGFFLIAGGPLPPGWQPVSRAEALQVWGKGNSQNRNENKPPTDPTDDDGCPSAGLARHAAFTMNAELSIEDTPLSYNPPIGPSMDFTAHWNQNEQGQPGSFSFSNLGPNWSLNWVSWITVDASKNATVHVRGGGIEAYPYSVPDNVSNPYPSALTSQAVLSIASSGVYQRSLPDGSIEVFNLADGTGNLFLTQIIDAQGNAATIDYDLTTFRINKVLDANGNATTFSYVSNTEGNPGYYMISGLTDPFGRTCSFSFDSTNTYMLSITDSIGLVSKFSYNTTTSFVNSLNTPYGTTTFVTYTPTGGTYPPRGLRIHYADGTSSVMESYLDHDRNTYFWDRHAMSLYPNDPVSKNYSHCRVTKWLIEPVTLNLSPVAAWKKAPLESQINFSYANQGDFTVVGKDNLPTVITRDVTGNAPQVGTITGAATANDVVTLKVVNSFLTGGETTVQYLVLPGDTLNTIASGMAAAVNGSSALQNANVGVAATSTTNTFRLTCSSSAAVAYFPSVSTGGTEFIDLVAEDTPSLQQKWQYEYNSLGRVTRSIDPLTPVGRNFSYKYAANEIDLLEVRETQGSDNFLLGKWQFNNSQHVPSLSIDGSGRRTSYTYNSFAQPTSMTDALSNLSTATYTAFGTATLGGTITAGDSASITFVNPSLSGGQEVISRTVGGGDTLTTVADALRSSINSNSDLQSQGIAATNAGPVISIKSTSVNRTTYTPNTTGTITLSLSPFAHGFLTQAKGPLQQQDKTDFTWNLTGTLASVSDSESYTRAFEYDSMDRLTKTTFPDATTEQIIYRNLDAVMFVDRLRRTTLTAFDALRQPIFVIDPLGRKTSYTWCSCGSPKTLTDGKDQVTTWNHDLQGRTIQKVYQDSKTLSYSYDLAGRLSKRSDSFLPTPQKTNYAYNLDNTLASISYTDAINPTSTVNLTYDSKFNRLTRAENGWGRYDYTHNDFITDPFAAPTTGGGRLASVSNNVIPNSTLTFLYDALGRTTNRSINGSANSITWTFDAMSRVTQEVNAMGTFGFTYVDNVSPNSKGLTRLASISYPNSQSTKFTWYDNARDKRLREIQNLDPSSQVLSQFNYAHDAEGQITRWLQQQKSSHQSFALEYDPAGQLVSAVSGQGTQTPPFANQHFFNYDTAANRTAVQTSQVQNVVIGGTKTTNDVITVNVFDSALTGGTVAVQYTVLAGDTLSSIATNLAATITATANLQAAGIDAVAGGTTISLRSKSPNVTTYTTGLSGSATETATVGMNLAMHNATVGGTVTTADQVKITVFDPALSGGQTTVTYVVAGGDSLTAIATGLKNAINASGSLATAGITATSAGPVVAIQSLSPNVTSYAKPATPSTTETISFGPSLNGSVNAQVVLLNGESITTGDILTITAYDAGLSGGSLSVTETIGAGETLANLATNLAGTINGTAALQAVGVSASASGARLTLASVSTNPTSYAAKVTNSGGTALGKEAILVGLPANGTTTASIAGSVASGDQFTLTAYDAALSGGSIAKTVTSQTTPNGVATALAAAINGDSNLTNQGITAVAAIPTTSVSVVNVSSTSNNATTYTFSKTGSSTIALSKNVGVSQATFNNVNQLTAISAGGATRFQGTTDRPVLSNITVDGGGVTMNDSRSFSANPVLSSGSESVAISATAGGGSGTTTNNYKFEVIGSASQTLTFDANGNMTSDGTNTWSWDAENRLIQITYPSSGNNTQFTYDPFGRNVKIEERTSGSVTATRQFIWHGNDRREERDASGALVKQFFSRGQRNGSTNFFYAKDHLGSIRGLTDNSGVSQASYSFDPYGRVTKLQETVPSDFGFAGYYLHARSGLNLTVSRAYSAELSRWISRDPIAERGSLNLYGYVSNNPLSFVDPLGRKRCLAQTPTLNDPFDPTEMPEPQNGPPERWEEPWNDPGELAQHEGEIRELSDPPGETPVDPSEFRPTPPEPPSYYNPLDWNTVGMR